MTKAQEREREFTLMKADVKWIKLKVGAMSKTQDDTAKLLSKISMRLFKDEETGFEGYFAVTRKLVIRVSKLETVKKAIWSALVLGSGAVGWILKVIYDKL